MPSNVSKCMVEECRYNENNECHALGIQVMSSTKDRNVDQSANTMCQTFESKI